MASRMDVMSGSLKGTKRKTSCERLKSLRIQKKKEGIIIIIIMIMILSAIIYPRTHTNTAFFIYYQEAPD